MSAASVDHIVPEADHMGKGLRRAGRHAWRVIKVASLWLGAAAALIGVAYVFARSGVDVQRLSGAVRSIRPWGAGLQCLAAAALVWCWPTLVAWAHRAGHVSAADVQPLLNWRARMARLMVVYLLLVPIGPDALLRGFEGLRSWF